MYINHLKSLLNLSLLHFCTVKAKEAAAKPDGFAAALHLLIKIDYPIYLIFLPKHFNIIIQPILAA